MVFSACDEYVCVCVCKFVYRLDAQAEPHVTERRWNATPAGRADQDRAERTIEECQPCLSGSSPCQHSSDEDSEFSGPRTQLKDAEHEMRNWRSSGPIMGCQREEPRLDWPDIQANAA